MADKPRVKAPQRRGAAKPDDSADRRRLLLIGGGAATLLVVVAGAFLLLGAGGDSASAEDAQAAITAAGCTLEIKPALVGQHTLTPDQTSNRWNTDPPTSGPHNQDTIIYGAYEEPLQTARMLHNLEHGAIYILYGDDVAESTVAQLRTSYDAHRNGTLLAPYPELGDQFALGAWLAEGLPEASSDNGSGIVAKCKSFDQAAFDTFFAAFQFKGPESSFIRPGDMEPGEQ